MSFGDESLGLPTGGIGGGSGNTAYANIQFNPPVAGTPVQLTANPGGSDMFIQDSTTASNDYTKKTSTSEITVENGNGIVVINDNGTYQHDIAVSYTIDGVTNEGDKRTTMCELVKEDNSALGDDTSYSIIETNGNATRMETFTINTVIAHDGTNNRVKLKFVSEVLNDVMKIKQIKWIVRGI